jgi:OFA family oxalate/formate antiporter-like MFS transporter
MQLLKVSPMDDSASSRLPLGLDKVFYGWWIVAACFYISFYVAAIISYSFTAYIDPLVKEFGWSYTEVSFAMSLRGLEMSFLAPVVGFFVDRYGSRALCLLGVMTVGIGFILLSLTQSLWLFYASIILIAFGGGGCTGVVMNHAVSNWFQKRIGLALGIMNAGVGACGLLIPVVVWLIDACGWRSTVVILGVGTWISCIPLALVFRDTPEKYGLHPDGAAVTPAAAVHTGGSESAQMGFADAIRNRAFLFVALSDAIRMMAAGAVITHIMPYLNLLQVPRSTAGLIAGAISVVSIPGRFGFGWFADLFDKRCVAAVACGLTSVGVLLLCYVDTGWVMLLFLLLYPIGFGGWMTVRSAILQEYFGRTSFGRLIGLVMGCSAVGSIIGPTLAGYLFDTTGTYFYTWIMLGIASSFSVVLMLNLGPRKQA